MANIKSAEKRIKVIENKTAVNRQRKSQIKTYMKKLNTAIDNGNIEEAQALLKVVQKKLFRAAAKGTMHKHAASRKVSQLTKKINSAM